MEMLALKVLESHNWGQVSDVEVKRSDVTQYTI